MSTIFLDKGSCSVNNNADCDDIDERSLLINSPSSSRQQKNQSKIDVIRDAIRPLSYGSTRHPDLDSSITNEISRAYDSNVGVINGESYDEDDRSRLESQKLRHKYYSRLDRGEDGKFDMPAHVLPSECYSIITVEDLESKKQSSFVTIFSIWSTMMGTSILSIPWAIERSGFACGIILLVVMAAICLYTAHLIVKSKSYIGVPGSLELDFTDICKYYLGRWGEWVSVITSLISLTCATMVYWILMSNFLFNDVDFIYDKFTDKFNSTIPLGNETAYNDVVCIVQAKNHSVPKLFGVSDFSQSNELLRYAKPFDPTSIFTLGSFQENDSTQDNLYSMIWNVRLTVPLFLIVIIFPLLNFKSPTFFTKISAFGSISILFLVSFVIRKAFKWGIHLNFHDDAVLPAVPLFKWSFPAMTGMLSLAYFIHNCILSILRNQKKPENNGRDLTIAFVCVMTTLMIIGITFYATFPLDKSCLSDNLLNNLVPSDSWAFMVRIVLLIQLVAVFPMLAYVFRIQVLKTLFGSIYPSLKHVLIFNVLLIGMCVSVAIFFPHVGNIIRYCGSICGFGYVFTLPSVVLMMRLKEYKQLNFIIIIIHSVLIGLAAANCVVQFFI